MVGVLVWCYNTSGMIYYVMVVMCCDVARYCYGSSAWCCSLHGVLRVCCVVVFRFVPCRVVTCRVCSMRFVLFSFRFSLCWFGLVWFWCGLG